MRIGQVNFPEELLDAQRDGTLVIFAGAGVSIPAPSNFPNFRDLAERVARETVVRREREPTDRFLGRVNAKGLDVHRIVQEILSDRTSSPNDLHFNVLKLFASAPAVRLVTTNFDMHFSTGAQEVFKGSDPAVEVFAAPALPEGDTFRGIVYLHGSVEKPCERMVLTDADFGRAYLTAGWARRFLQTLFVNFNVLFIGYSHEDTVMEYLARGLTPNAAPKRYALVPDENKEKWELLGITPIPYPLGAGEARHGAAAESLRAWAQLAGTGVLDTEENIRRIVHLPPPEDGPDADYIERALRDIYTTRFFTSHATSPDWLRWVEKRGVLSSLFKPGAGLSPIDFQLAIWFADRFIFGYPEEALAVIQRQGLALNSTFRAHIEFKLFTQKGDQGIHEGRARWLAILHSSPTGLGRADHLEFLLEGLRFPEDKASIILLFELLTTPRIRLTENPLWEERGRAQVRPEICTPGRNYHLSRAWVRIIRPNLASFADKLCPVVTNHLAKAHQLSKALSVANEVWDPTSYGRSAIEPHEQDSLQDELDPVIDAARDILEWYLDNKPDEGITLVHQWWRSEAPILRRLALHGVRRSSSLEPDEKIALVLEGDLLYSGSFRHELFQLLREAYPHAGEECLIALLKVVADGPQERVEKVMWSLRTTLYSRYSGGCMRRTQPASMPERSLRRFRRSTPDTAEVNTLTWALGSVLSQWATRAQHLPRSSSPKSQRK